MIKKLTIPIHENAVESLKIIAKRQGIPLKDFIQNALYREINGHSTVARTGQPQLRVIDGGKGESLLRAK